MVDTVTNPLEMSDEDFANYVPPVDEEENQEDEVVNEPEATDSPSEVDEPVEETDDPQDDDPQEESELETEQDELETSEEENKDELDDSGSEKTTDTEDDKKDDTDTSDTDEVDFKAEYQKLLAPFVANGRTMSVNNVDEAIALMQMGANYNKKMAGLKPVIKLTKMLENHDLLSEDKLSYLIDLSKHDKNAINKLVKDAGLDAVDIDTDKATDYNPNTYTVDDKQVELDDVLDEIQGTETYSNTVDVIANKWDKASQKVLTENPHIIRFINDQMSNGVFEQISQRVERERMFNRLEGLTDIEAYQHVGKLIQAEGGFGQPANANEKIEPKVEKKQDPKLSQRRRAAAPPKGKPSAQAVKEEYNPLALSDEEFMKLASNQFS